MPNTPILGITQVSASQNSKEVTINDAILALESATNAVKDVSFALSSSVLLTGTEATRAFIFVAKAGEANCSLSFPNAINSINVNRIVAVRNESGFALTVRFNTGAGSTVLIPNNQTRLLALIDGLNVIVAAEPATVVNFVSLTDTPSSYSGQASKFLAVNLAENALIFVDAATFPAFTGQAGKYLVVNALENGVEWVDLATVTGFTDLTDAPDNYTGAGGKLVAVNDAETGVEFIDPPEAEAVEFISAARWRIFIVEPGSETKTGFGEVEFLDNNGFNLVGTGTSDASTFDVGKEPEFAFNGNVTPGAGWLTAEGQVVNQWIEYQFDAPVALRSFRLFPITNFPDYTPTRVRIEYFDGAVWTALGDRITGTWVEATPKTFKVNGVPLSSVPDAPADGEQYVRRNNAWEALDDPLPSLTGQGEKLLAVKTDETGTEWVATPSGTLPSVTGQANKFLAVKPDESGSEWINVPEVYRVGFFFNETPLSSEPLLRHTFTDTVSFPDDFAGAHAGGDNNPAATFVMDIQKEGVSVGTLSISTTGITTFATAGGGVVFNPGETMWAFGPAVADTTIAGWSITLKGVIA